MQDVSEGTNDVLRFLSFVTPYFHPSNLESWTFTLGAFLHYFAYELACRMGSVAGLQYLQQSHPSLATALTEAQPGTAESAEIAAHEVVALMDALLPLCQQALYSKMDMLDEQSKWPCYFSSRLIRCLNAACLTVPAIMSMHFTGSNSPNIMS